MRRKSSRYLNKSVDKSETDSPHKTSENSSNTRSSRRHKRSPSMSKNEVEDKTPMNSQNDGVELVGTVDEQISPDRSTVDIVNMPSPVSDSNSKLLESKNITESQQECDIKEDKEINQEVKGKSKGKNKTKFDHSRNEIGPKTENDNVQDISESPPNDNECTQNSVDSTQKDPQKPEIIEHRDTEMQIEKEQQKMELDTFESEYVDNTTVSKTEEVIESKENREDAEIEERSTTPALPNTTMDKNATSEDKPGTVEHEGILEKGSRKRITLKRLPPQNQDEHSKNQVSSSEERSVIKDKTSKRITLKRQTIDDIPASDNVLKSTDPVRRSSLNVTTHGNERRLSSQSEEQNHHDPVRRSSLNETTLKDKRRLSSQSEEQVHKDVGSRSSVDETAHEDKKRLSSQSEEHNNHEDVANKPLKRVKLNRNVSLESQGTETAKRSGKQPWGRSEWLNKLSATMYKIDVDSIKTVCPSVEFLKESEIKLKTAPRERIKSESSEIVKRKLSLEKSEDESEKHNSESESVEEPKIDPNPNIIALNRKISIVDDTASKMRPPASPAKNPKSEILFISNLVRPFTVKQLKELLERTGKIQEDGFWTDRIKSKCYARYESEEEAEATRNALHGVSWPIGNGKQLVIDFATEEDMQKARNPVPAVPVVPEILPEKENRFQEPDKLEIRHREQEVEEKRHHETGRDRSREETRRRHSRSRSRERIRRHSRRSYTPEVLMKKKPKKEEVPQKLMDDLFLKTKATPSIYWQPLCPQEIALKQQQRLVRMEEHKRRIEETRTRLRDVRRAPFRRR
ncbi:unnamed protein product [Phaedon cochleariae]|uniref:RRM domain-containing protein n=1 Tax=Phaedon cochleariae TaxID=80249 RepID=A0A9P0DW72_PHACE|nr:unnamed protein product [Phaedon cochleariae]